MLCARGTGALGRLPTAHLPSAHLPPTFKFGTMAAAEPQIFYGLFASLPLPVGDVKV